MKRKLMAKLMEWRLDKRRKPLILEGARQVGKTYLLKEFGRKYYDNVIYINLENPSPELSTLFDGAISPERIITSLELLYHEEISKKRTLIFFDEIQELPRALTSLKYFCEEAPEYHIVASGSLLGLFLHSGTSFPVGKVDLMRLEPMNFEEFLWASGEKRITEHLKSNLEDGLFDEVLLDNFRHYLAVGGMPEAVKLWVDEHNITKVEQVHNFILQNYLSDFSKHTDATTSMRIRQVWDSLVSQFAKNNDKFVYGAIRSGARARDFEIAIQWLVDSGIVRKVMKVSAGNSIPLKAYQNPSAFKLYFIDIGLLRTLAQIPTPVIMQKDALFNEFNGLLAEQYVLQQLAPRTLYFWTSDAKSEVDFVTQISSDITPIEVKSGENVRAKSLQVYRKKYNPRLAVRFSLKKLEYNSGLLNVPLYKSWLFDRLVDSHRVS
ncbi:MAG: AAA family ATPase [Candidatus Ancillula sp.]|jgi:predicted AAA+ superfamily ATPase|nr:AAA family ATPase [Candidatus Ancillula sp.]